MSATGRLGGTRPLGGPQQSMARPIPQPRRRGRGGADWIPVGVAILVILGAVTAGMLAADSAILTVALACALALGVAIVLRPDVATLTAIAILYSNAAVVAVRFHGVPAFAAAAVPMLLVIPLARDLVVRRLPIVAPPMLGWMIVLLVIHLVSASFSTDVPRSWDATVVFIVEGVGLYFMLVNVIRTPELLRQVTWVLLVVGAGLAVLSIHQVLTSNYDSIYFGFAQPSAAIRTGQTLAGEVVQRRLAGPIGETNRFAQVMLMLVPLGIFRYIGERTPTLRLTAGVLTALIAIAVVMTFSRGAAVGMGALILALIVLRMVRLRHILLFVVGITVVLAWSPQYASRILSIAEVGALTSENAATSGASNVILSRATETLAAALVMADHPILGVGPDMFNDNYQHYAEIVGLFVREGETREAHNLYMGYGAELGVVGLAVFLWIAWQTIAMVARARRRSLRRRPDLEQLTTPFALALMTYYVTGLFLHLSFARYYWLMVALASAAAVITLREMDAVDEAESEDPAVASDATEVLDSRTGPVAPKRLDGQPGSPRRLPGSASV